MPIRTLKHILLATLCALISTPALSDTINEPWQSRREAATALEDKACKGDARSVREVWRKIEQVGDPVHQNNLGWLSANCDSFDASRDEIVRWLAKSAAAGYPVALSNYGLKLIRGEDVKKNSTKGVVFLLDAHKGGYATAIAYLSEEFATGKNMRHNMRNAKAYLHVAKRDGADAPAIERAEKAIAAAGGTASSSSSSSLAESAAKIKRKKGESILSAIGRTAAESVKNCAIRLSHTCDNFKRFEGRTFQGQAHIMAERIESVSFAGCQNIHSAKMTFSNNQLRIDPKLKNIPKQTLREFEGLLLAFNRFVLHKYPGCSNNAETKLSYYKHHAGASMAVASTIRSADRSEDDAWKVRF